MTYRSLIWSILGLLLVTRAAFSAPGTLSATGEGMAGVMMQKGTLTLTGSGNLAISGNPTVKITGTPGEKTTRNRQPGMMQTAYKGFKGKAVVTGDKLYAVNLIGTITALTASGSGQATLMGKGVYTVTRAGAQSTRGVWNQKPAMNSFGTRAPGGDIPGTLSAQGDGQGVLMMRKGTMTLTGACDLTFNGNPSVKITGTPGKKTVRPLPSSRTQTIYKDFKGKALILANKIPDITCSRDARARVWHKHCP